MESANVTGALDRNGITRCLLLSTYDGTEGAWLVRVATVLFVGKRSQSVS